MLGMLLLVMVVTLACGGTTTDGVYRTPIVERGVCATILMPGETMPMPEPGESPGCQGGYTSIAGGGVVEESQKTTKSEPHPVMKALGAPFVVLLFPFKLAAAGAGKLYDTVSGKEEEVPMDPRLRKRQAQVAKVDPQAAHEQEQLSALERELEQRGGRTESHASGPAMGAGNATATTPGGAAPARPRLSIADELATLRGGNAPPVPVPLPAPRSEPEIAPGDGARAPTPSTSPRADAGGPRADAGGPADRALDRDGDGRPDHWIYLSQGRPEKERFDDNGDGAPDRTVLRDPASGEELRVEEDRNGDGRVDTVSEYKNGQIARIRRDSDFDGGPDAWSFYRAGQLTREEQDPDGDGFRNRIVLYRDGQLASEREDRDADGRIDRITRYDAEQRVLQRDEDQDGDGLVDARAYYENGRLVRRELVSESQGDAIEEEEDLSSAAWSTDAGEARR
jgi:hypothetical protein